jgi:hypothetical protein
MLGRVIIWPNRIIMIITTITAITISTVIAITPITVRLMRPRLSHDHNSMTRISTMSTADICMRLIQRC